MATARDEEGAQVTAMTGQSATIERFQTPLYTASETARYLDVPVSTVQSGAQVLYDFSAGGRHARIARANADVVVLRDGQAVFSGVAQDYLRRLDFDSDGYPDLLRLPEYGGADVIVDPGRCFGQPIFAHGGARLDDALALFCSGEPLDIVAAEYDLPREQLEGAVRIATRSAA